MALAIKNSLDAEEIFGQNFDSHFYVKRHQKDNNFSSNCTGKVLGKISLLLFCNLTGFDKSDHVLILSPELSTKFVIVPDECSFWWPEPQHNCVGIKSVKSASFYKIFSANLGQVKVKPDSMNGSSREM